MTGDCHIRFCERLGVKFPLPTRHENVICKAKGDNTLKEKIENKEKKLTVWKDFVFDDLLLPSGSIWEAHAHCTHLQIAYANPQTKFCKRVLFCCQLNNKQNYSYCL